MGTTDSRRGIVTSRRGTTLLQYKYYRVYYTTTMLSIIPTDDVDVITSQPRYASNCQLLT